MKKKEIEVLLELKKTMELLIAHKLDQINIINDEIENLKSQSGKITSIISKSSFSTAKTLLNAEEAAKNIKTDTKNINLTRKIFSKEKELLVSIQFQDDSIFIRLLNVKKIGLTQEKYINLFVKPILIELKEKEKDLSPNIIKKQVGKEEFIEIIELKNVFNFDSFDFLFGKTEELIKNICM